MAKVAQEICGKKEKYVNSVIAWFNMSQEERLRNYRSSNQVFYDLSMTLLFFLHSADFCQNFSIGRSIYLELKIKPDQRNPGRFGPIPVRSGRFGPISGVSRFGPNRVGLFGPILKWVFSARF